MRRFFIILFIGLSLIVIGAVCSWIAIEHYFSGPELKGRIETASSKFLRRPLTIDQLHWQHWPAWSLVGTHVQLWENDKKTRVILDSPIVEARIRLLSIYRLAISIRDLRFVHPRGTLRKLENGATNVSRMIDDIQKQPEEPERKWGRVTFHKFTVENGLLLIEDTPVSIDSEINIDGKPEFTGVVKSTSAKVAYDITLKDTSPLLADIKLSTVQYLSSSFNNIHTAVHQTTGTYLLDPTAFEGLGGSIAVQGSYNPQASSDALKMVWDVKNIQIHDLYVLLGSTRDPSGLLTSHGYIETGAGLLFLPAMNGEMNFNLKNGWFGNATGILKVLTKLNLRTLLTEVEGKHESHVPFDETHGKIQITNGVASTIEPFVVKNKTLQMVFMGNFNLADKTVDGKIAVHTLLLTDEIIHKIPIVNIILLGDKKSLIPLWVSVKGNVDDPKVHVLKTKSIGSPIWDTIKNTFGLPETLMNKVRGK